MVKFIIVSGGVLSGLGKGITAASIGLLLKSRGIKVTIMKCDMYLNIDSGTMSPIEHGEVFVTDDGLETDQDLGHYERFLGETLNRSNYLTNGQIYKLVLDKERALDYDGICVQPYHHIPPEIIKKWRDAGGKNNVDVVIVELGGTTGEYEGLLFFEAYRRLKLKEPKNCALVHVGYLPAPNSIGELKSKPLQQSVSLLNSLGIQPDFIIGRAQLEIDMKRKEKIALTSGLPIENIISNPDVDSVYDVPIVLEKQLLATKLIKKLGIKSKKKDLSSWKEMLEKKSKTKKSVNIGIIGKYQKTGDYTLEDSYISVVEALKHAGFELNLNPQITWIDSQSLELKNQDEIKKVITGFDGIIVPQGWGKRGVEGKIKSIRAARENNIPYLGLCFGMQMAVIEFARNVLGFSDANSTEVNPDTKHPVIHIMPSQEENLLNKNYGGTIRLGSWPCKVKKGTKLFDIYKKDLISERHRHRYEFNNKYKSQFEKKGFLISGTSPDGKLVEAIEIEKHKFFVGTQFHPEYISRPLAPHPLFVSFLASMI
ncbi:MAG: CTP synthase [Patescibacteria group bacterium]